MAIVYLDSAYAGSQGAVSGDLGHGAGHIWTRPDQYWASAVDGDNVYFRDDRVWVPNAGKFFTLSGIDNKRLIIGRYGNGSEIPFLDGSYYEDTVAGWAHIGGGVWQKTINTGGGWSAANSHTMWIGATRPTTAKSSWVRGTMYRKANGNYASGFVNGNNPLNGNGIWYTYNTGSDFIAQVWTGNSGAGGDPITTYGGLRFLDGNGSTGGAAFGLVFIGANSSGSEVHEVAAFGFRRTAMGSTEQGADGTVDGLLFDSVQMLGSKFCFLLQSDVADTFVKNIELSGDWLASDYIDAATSPSVGDVDEEEHNSWEIVSVDNRVQDVTISGGLIIQGGGHGAFNFAPTAGGADGAQTRPARITVDGSIVRCDRIARNARALAVQTTDDVRISRVKFTGQGTASKANGNRTVITQCEWSEAGAALANQGAGTALVQVTTEVGAGTINVTFSNNWLDGRGRVAYGATKAWGVFQLRATSTKPLAAGAVTADCNILIGDSGCAAVRAVTNGSATNNVNTNQTFRSNWWNTGVGAIECFNRAGGDAVGGVATTLPGYFTTGVTSGNTEKTLGQLASGGGGRPMTRQGVVHVDRLPFN